MKNLNFKERVDLDIKEIEKTKERFKLFINRHHKSLEKISPNLISKLCLTFGFRVR